MHVKRAESVDPTLNWGAARPTVKLLADLAQYRQTHVNHCTRISLFAFSMYPMHHTPAA
jgi:hypothetical protein